MSLDRFLKSAKHANEVINTPKKKRKAKHHEVHDESNWLVSYADMMTLLCGFFIMLFSLAHLDEPQYEKMKEAVAKQFGGQYQPPNQELKSFVSQVVSEAGLEREAVVRADPKGVWVTFESTLFFDTLSSEVKDQGKAILTKLIDQVYKRQEAEKKQYRIVVEGHTDSRAILGGIYPSNWELSAARASRVVRMFLERGFTAERLTAIGYADTRPEVPSRTPAGTEDPEALAKNRRVVLRILDPRVDSIPYPEAPQQTANAVTPAPAAPTN